MEELKLINFSKGVDDTQINHNFNALQKQINKERLNVGGKGISSGLNLSINDFALTVNSGYIVNNSGNEVGITGSILQIDKPELSIKIERKTSNNEGWLELDFIPYSNTRSCTAQYDLLNSNIEIKDTENIMNKITIQDIVNNNLLIKPNINAEIKYNMTGGRYDTIYISNDDKLKIAKGITSTTPSVYAPEDCQFLLAIVYIDPFYLSDNKKVAKALIKESFNDVRNIYTDNNNVLYICGVPFEELQIIHLIEPKNPKENTFWYDSYNNILKVWRVMDNIPGWVDVNNYSIVPNTHIKLWAPIDNPYDLQYFIFPKEEIDLKFIPNTNSLNIAVEQGVLLSDQFVEITLDDGWNDENIANILKQYGYTDEDFNTSEEFENIGVGFCLANPLDEPCYIEAKVTHKIFSSPFKTRFQRTATFIEENTVRFDNVSDGDIALFDVPCGYTVGENQLEVYVDRERLIKGIDYYEGTDIGPRIRGEKSFQFGIVEPPYDKHVTYKVTKSVYSYDTVNDLISGLNDGIDAIISRIDNMESEVQNSSYEISKIKTQIKELDDNFTIMAEQMNVFSDILRNLHLTAFKGIKTDTITINSGSVYELANIKECVLAIGATSSGKALSYGVDFTIDKDLQSGKGILTILTPAKVTQGETITINAITV